MKSIKEIIKKVAQNEYLSFFLLIKELYQMTKGFYQLIVLSNPKILMSMDYFDIGIKVIIVIWLFYMIREQKKIQTTVKVNALVTKFLNNKMKYNIGSFNMFDEEVLKRNFSKEEIELLIALKIIEKDEKLIL